MWSLKHSAAVCLQLTGQERASQFLAATRIAASEWLQPEEGCLVDKVGQKYWSVSLHEGCLSLTVDFLCAYPIAS